MSQDSTDLNVVMAMTEASEMFDDLCQQRHDHGAAEYGALTFLENDTIRMMCEELADTANYARYHFIKLMLLQEQFLAENPSKIDIGAQAFKGTGEGWKDKK